ncbi:MAG: RDD family protein [Fimbriimonadaceae bacterium]
MTQEHLILSPEKTLLSFRLAPISRRMWAHLVDLMILVGINTMATYLAFLFFMSMPDFAMALGSFLAAFAFFGYFALCEAKYQGQTLGKKALNVRVISADGTPITVRQAWLRNLLRIADVLPVAYVAGVTSILASPRAQRLGDMVAGTMVVVEPKVSTNFAAAPHRYGVHHFEQYLAELPNMTLEEYIAMKRLCDRFPYLPAEEQARSIQDLWVPFAERHQVPAFANVHPILMMEAVVMRFSRIHHLV